MVIVLLKEGEASTTEGPVILKLFRNSWRKSTVFSPIHLRTLAIGERPIGENLIGEVPVTHFRYFLDQRCAIHGL
jgi:hypothetical protein